MPLTVVYRTVISFPQKRLQSAMALRVLGVLGGKDMPPERVAAWAKSADIVLAADSGADQLLSQGISPTIAIGDLDSAQANFANLGIPILHLPDQSCTDCDKLLAHALSQGYRDLTLIGVEGDRLDHVLATLSSAIASPLRIRIALRRGIGWLVKLEWNIEVDTTPGQRLSVMPLTLCEGVCVAGVAWSVNDMAMKPGGLVSISNRATGGSVTISIKSGTALFVLERSPNEPPDWTEPKEAGKQSL